MFTTTSHRKKRQKIYTINFLESVKRQANIKVLYKIVGKD